MLTDKIQAVVRGILPKPTLSTVVVTTDFQWKEVVVSR